MTVNKNEHYWSRFADAYDTYAEYVVGKTLRKAVFRRLSEERNLGEAIEFGCGTAYFTSAIARNAKHVIASDISEEMLKVSEKRLKKFNNITLLKIDCEDLPFQPESFDTVLIANVLHVIKDPCVVLRGSHRILKAGGLLIVTSYTDYGMTFSDKMRLGLRYFIKFGVPPVWGIKNYSPEELCFLVEDAGFRKEDLLLIGDKPKAIYLKGRKK